MEKKIKIYVNDDNKAQKIAKNLKEELLNYNLEIVDSNYNIAISVGGDGSFLRMIKDNNFNSNISYVGINSGTLGFLQEIDYQKTNDFVSRLARDDYKKEELSIEESIITTKNQTFTFESLNEIVLRQGDFTILKVPVYIDGELLEYFAGDGLLISTPTGSTAYNMSFNGPIIYNTLNVLSLTPIAPLNNRVYHSLINPLVIPKTKTISIIPNEALELFLMVDGKIHKISDVLKIEIKVSSKTIKCLRMNDFHFIKRVYTKLLEKE